MKRVWHIKAAAPCEMAEGKVSRGIELAELTCRRLRWSCPCHPLTDGPKNCHGSDELACPHSIANHHADNATHRRCQEEHQPTCGTPNNSSHTSSAFDTTESRLGLGWKAARRLCWWEDGRIRDARDLLISSPSTPPILTMEFFIADLSMFSRLEGNDTV